jgi:ribose-phosphate pyrophosphokinase
VCADAIEAAGARRVLTMDLHAAQVQGFFRIPVDDLYALPILCEAIESKALHNVVVVAPDAGFAKKARLYANRLGANLAIADKVRSDHSENAKIVDLIGDVEGCTAVIVDDFTISAGTLVNASNVLMEKGASAVYAAVTHGLLAGNAMEALHNSPIEKLFITDTVETQPIDFSEKIEVVSAAALFGEAIRRIARRESISILFS